MKNEIMKTKNNRLIVVLGMHRSGTSAVTRGLKVLGVSLGETLYGAMAGVNEKGFWEDIHLNALNVEMLDAIESDWSHVGAIDSSDVEILHKQGYFLRAPAGGHLLDPRTVRERENHIARSLRRSGSAYIRQRDGCWCSI